MLPKGLLKEHSRTIAFLTRTADMAMVFVAGWLAFIIKFAHFEGFDSFFSHATLYTMATLCGVLLTPIVFSFFDIYRSVRGRSLISHFFTLLQAMLAMILILAGLAFFSKVGELYSRVWFGLWMALSLFSVVTFRLTLLLCFRFMRSHGLNERRVVIMGAGNLGVKFASTVQQALWTGYRIVAFVDDHIENKPTDILGKPVIQTPSDLGAYLIEQQIDEIWLALPLRAEERVKAILHELRYQTITTRFVLNIFELDLLNHSIADIAGFPVLNICSTPMTGVNRLVKAIEDRVLAACILTCISPFFLLIALAVKWSSPGPIFYRQKRVSWNGREFDMLKFRTMPLHAETKTGPVWATAQDDRATFVGKYLRRTSLDELPQFINVLMGDMSIVGPRPERKIFVDQFKEKVPRYMHKHFVKAGITGWAQVNGWRGNTNLEKRVEYDLYYIENWSLVFDLKIIFLTVFKGFIHRNAY